MSAGRFVLSRRVDFSEEHGGVCGGGEDCWREREKEREREMLACIGLGMKRDGWYGVKRATY